MLKNNKSTSQKLFAKACGLITLMASFSLFTSVQARHHKIATHPQLQSIVDRTLEDGVIKAKAKDGFAIVANPFSGEILALSRVKTINGKTKKVSAENFLSKTYEPYSHLKPMIAAIALEETNMHENTIIDANGGKIKIHNKFFYDWKNHGEISFIDSVANSSFVGVYRIAKAIGEKKLVKRLRDFGFDLQDNYENFNFIKKGKIDLSTGNNEKYNLAYLSNGMGNILASPLEVIQAYSVIANGGNLVQPKQYSKKGSETEIIKRTVSKNTAERMKYILLRTMTRGTGKWAQSSKYTIAGKTATGYIRKTKRTSDMYHKANRGLFIGFAPFNNPKLISLVIIDEPEGAAHGSRHAAPVVRSILNKSLANLGVKSDRGVSSN